MKKFALTAIALSVVSMSATAASPTFPVFDNSGAHDRYIGAVDNMADGKIVISNKDQLDTLKGLVGYGTPVAKQLEEAFANDGKITGEELKATDLSDHHFYTAYLGASTSQADYDKRLQLLTGVSTGEGIDDMFVNNRDLKAHGSMIMNQVETKNQAQDKIHQEVNAKQDAANQAAQDALSNKLDNVVSGLQQMGDVVPPTGGEYDDTAVKGDIETNKNDIATNKGDIATNKDNITTNSNNIQAMGDAFVGRVDTVNGYLEQVGNAIKNTSNAGLADRMDTLEGAFAAQAEQTAQEIGRLDGRIDELEQKTDKMKAGIAGATAIASLTQYTGNGTHHIAVGVGAYDGAAALAAGYTYAVSKQTTVRATLAIDSEKEATIGASVGHSW